MLSRELVFNDLCISAVTSTCDADYYEIRGMTIECYDMGKPRNVGASRFAICCKRD